MIGRICGKLLDIQVTEIQVEVQGIAYEIQIPMSTLYQLPQVGEDITLHTHFAVREDAQTLYGFFSIDEKKLFRALVKVSGVGPKLALAILSGMEVSEFVQTVARNDVASLVRMPGVGKKTAERLIVEMRDRMQEWQIGFHDKVSGEAPLTGTAQQISHEAETALISLGYKPAEAGKAVGRVMQDNADITDSGTLIRLALRSMG